MKILVHQFLKNFLKIYSLALIKFLFIFFRNKKPVFHFPHLEIITTTILLLMFRQQQFTI